MCKNISGFKAQWYSSEKIQYASEKEEKTELEKFLADYIRNGNEQIEKLKEYQHRSDSLEMNVK